MAGTESKKNFYKTQRFILFVEVIIFMRTKMF